MPIFVGLLTTDLAIPEADSLKEKRHVLSGLLTRLRNRLKVAVAEVAYQDCHRLARIATVTVSNSTAQTHRMLSAASQFIQSQPRVTVQSETVEII